MLMNLIIKNNLLLGHLIRISCTHGKVCNNAYSQLAECVSFNTSQTYLRIRVSSAINAVKILGLFFD